MRREGVGVRSEEGGRSGTACRAFVRREGVWLAGFVFLRWLAGSRPRRASYFFLRRQKKVTKKKASHVRAASRSLALLAAFGTLANSLRSNSASVLIRTLLRCSARPNGGGIPHGSSASRTSPEWLVRFAHIAGFGCLTAHTGTARRATTPSPLIPHTSLRIMGNHKGCPYDLLPQSYDLTPTTSLLTPHPSLLTPHPSLLTPHSSLLTPHPSLLTPHSYDLTPHPSLLTPHPSLSTQRKHRLQPVGFACRRSPGP